jgi:hypothetical protein
MAKIDRPSSGPDRRVGSRESGWSASATTWRWRSRRGPPPDVELQRELQRLVSQCPVNVLRNRVVADQRGSGEVLQGAEAPCCSAILLGRHFTRVPRPVKVLRLVRRSAVTGPGTQGSGTGTRAAFRARPALIRRRAGLGVPQLLKYVRLLRVPGRRAAVDCLFCRRSTPTRLVWPVGHGVPQ